MKPSIKNFNTQRDEQRGSIRPLNNNHVRIKPIVALFIWICLLASCSPHQKPTIEDGYSFHGDTLRINSPTPLSVKLRTDTAKQAEYRPDLAVAGIIRAIPNQYAEIASPFAGRLLRSFITLGMKVNPGTPLFEINSSEFLVAQKTFFQEKEQLALAEKKLARQKNLLAHGVGVAKDLEEAQSAYNVEKKEYENALQGILLYKADPDRLILGQPLVVRSPIHGEVIENKAVAGQYIHNDAASIAVVADLSRVWVAGQIKEKQLGMLQSLQNCSIRLDALPGYRLAGRIYHVSNTLDEQTRSVQVLVQCDNKHALLKPGMYVTVDFMNKPVHSIAIPEQAVLQQSNTRFVFKQLRPGEYIRQPVETQSSGSGQIYVSKGLINNDVIISDGAYLLSSLK